MGLSFDCVDSCSIFLAVIDNPEVVLDTATATLFISSIVFKLLVVFKLCEVFSPKRNPGVELDMTKVSEPE